MRRVGQELDLNLGSAGELCILICAFCSCTLRRLASKLRQKQPDQCRAVPQTSGGRDWWPQAVRGWRSAGTQSCGWAASTCDSSAGISACVRKKRNVWAFCVTQDDCGLFLEVEKKHRVPIPGELFSTIGGRKNLFKSVGKFKESQERFLLIHCFSTLSHTVCVYKHRKWELRAALHNLIKCRPSHSSYTYILYY